MKKTNKIWKKSFYALTVVGVFLLVYSMFQPSVAMTPDLNEIVVSRINKPVVNDLFTRSIRIRLNDPINIDQVQNQVTDMAYIGYLGGTAGCYKQLVYNDRSPFIGFDLAIGKKGTPTEPIYVGVFKLDDAYQSPLEGGSYYVLAGLDPAIDIPDDELVWFNFDFSSKPYYDGKRKVNIVMISMDDPTDGNYWLCGLSDGNPYTDGDSSFIWDVPLRWHWNSERWLMGGMNDYDFTFVTYSEGGSNGEDTPVISITTSFWVTVTQSIGILSLIGGVISGINFRWY